MAEAKRDTKIKHLNYAKTLVSSKAFQLAFVRSDFGLIFESREHFFGVVPIHPWPTENPSSLLLSSFYSSDLSSMYAMSRQSLPVWFLGPNITSMGLSWWMLQSSPSARCVKHSQTQEPSKESNLLSNISVWEHHKCIVLSSNWQDAFCLKMFKSYWRFLHIWGRTDWPQPYQTWDTLAFGPKQCLQTNVSVVHVGTPRFYTKEITWCTCHVWWFMIIHQHYNSYSTYFHKTNLTRDGPDLLRLDGIVVRLSDVSQALGDAIICLPGVQNLFGLDRFGGWFCDIWKTSRCVQKTTCE